MRYLIPDTAALEAQISDLKDAWLRDTRAHQDMCPATFSNCVPHDCGCGLTELREAEMDKIEKLNSQPPPAKRRDYRGREVCGDASHKGYGQAGCLDCAESGTSLSEGAKALDVTSRERPADSRMSTPINFSCRVCGVQCPIAPDPPARAVCPEHCEDHNYVYDPSRQCKHCEHCDEEIPLDWR